MSQPAQPTVASESAPESATESATMQKTARETPEGTSNRRLSHAGEGRLLGNLLVFIPLFVIFMACIYVLGFSDGRTAWPFGLSLVLAFLAFFIPQGILGRSDSGPESAAPRRTAK